MQGQEGNSLAALVHKIRRLKRKLLSYGWNRQESTNFILYEFLKLPQPQWEKPSTTLSYYQIKDKYKAEPNHAELILTLQQIVPNLHEEDVLDYLHSVFQYSALAYGFELFDSSSDSGENPTLIKKSSKGQRPVRHRPTVREQSPCTKKKLHKQEQEHQICNHKQQQPHEEIRLVRKRRLPPSTQFDQHHKQIKKEQQN